MNDCIKRHHISSPLTACCPYCSEVECDDDCRLAGWRPAGDDIKLITRDGQTYALNLSEHDRHWNDLMGKGIVGVVK